jgi:hypothetical protein
VICSSALAALPTFNSLSFFKNRPIRRFGRKT